MEEWFSSFFDRVYYETYRVFEGEERNEREAKFIVEALGLPPGSRILDLGCGYARHAVYLARWGYRVTCYDLSSYLLGKARERVEEFSVRDRVDLVQGDMRRLDYEAEYDGAYMFFTSFGYFSDEENVQTIAGVSRALRTGGRLLLDLLNPVRIMHDYYENGNMIRSWHRAEEYLVLEESMYDPLRSRIEARRLIYKAEGSFVDERWFTLRIYCYPEVEAMLRGAGLRVERLYGSTRGDEYKATSPRLIIVSGKE